MTQDELDIDVRLQYEINNKIEQQLISLCLTVGDDNLINTLEELTIDRPFKIPIKSFVIHSKKERCKLQKRSTSSKINIIPNIVNISIDSSSRSTTSGSTCSSKKNA